MLVELFAPPIFMLGNRANIWSLLWLSGRLIIRIERTNSYTSTFTNALTPKKAKTH